MTSTTGRTGTGTEEHPEVAEISALAEGILPPQRSTDVRGHLEACVLCADVRASLDEIRDLLGTLPGPPRMPADVAGRIDAALAAEALLDASPTPVSRETGAGDVSRETTTAADRPSGRSPAPSGPGRPRGRRRRWVKGALVTASAAAVLSLGGLLAHSLTAGSGASTSSSDSAVSDSAGASKQQSLEAHVHQLLAAAGASAHVEGGAGTGNGPMVKSSGSLPACVTEGIGRSGTPLAFDRGTYQGADSYLVVFPSAGDAAKVDAYLVDASCVTATPGKPGTVLSKDTYAR
ncbi:anti-sigma factor [Actinacidiphila soli]|uniref:hypothetical protein n=1 Tax=Actinacidiphila soli TaxID=2487275 RepID=UPI000FCC77BE|nr:hypothetical protein [Actinacidiphila soli]